MERATKVACCSSTVSSIEVPKPSFRISHMKILALAAAPYSLAQAMVMSKGMTWSLYQGRATSLKPWTSDRGMESRSATVALTGRAMSRERVELILVLNASPGHDIYVYRHKNIPLGARPSGAPRSERR